MAFPFSHFTTVQSDGRILDSSGLTFVDTRWQTLKQSLARVQTDPPLWWSTGKTLHLTTTGCGTSHICSALWCRARPATHHALSSKLNQNRGKSNIALYNNNNNNNKKESWVYSINYLTLETFCQCEKWTCATVAVRKEKNKKKILNKLQYSGLW